jgi:BMFP domain-containing protein YqiC
MQTNHPFFQDLSKMASSAAGAAMDVRREIEQMIAQQLRQLVSKMDLVSREEFDVVKAMAEKARSENAQLKAELDALKSKKK